ncbi:unnamed protein product, partial [Mesorhabditis spiculigera]
VTCDQRAELYWPGNGCYPGPEENSRLPNSIMFREQFKRYLLMLVSVSAQPSATTSAKRLPINSVCYLLAEHDVEHPCTCTSKSAPSIMMSGGVLQVVAASYSGECGKEQHRLRVSARWSFVVQRVKARLLGMTSNEADWGIAFREDITQKDGSMAIVTYVCERDAVFCSEGADGTSPWTATAPGPLGDKMGCWKNVKKPTPYSSGICENLDDAATTGLWPQLLTRYEPDFIFMLLSKDIVCSITARPWHPEHKCSAMQFEPRRTNDQIAFYENVLDTDGYGWTRIAYACGPLHSFCGGPKTPPEIEPGCWAGVARPYSSAECSYYGMISSMKAPMSISLKMLLEYYDKEVSDLGVLGKLALGEQRVFTRPANFTYPELWTTTTTTTTPTTTTPSTPSTPSWSRPEYIGPPTYPPVVYPVHDDCDHVDDDESPVGTLIAICVGLLLCCCAIFCICKCCWDITCDVTSKPWHPDHGGCVEVKREIGIEDWGIAFHENVTNKDGGWTYVTYACRESPYPDAVIFCGGPPAPPWRAVPKTPGCWSRTLRDDPQHSALKILLAAGDSDRRCLHFTKLIDRGSRPEFVFMVMELVGKSVKDVQRERRGKVFTISTACQVAEQTLEALEDMHALGYIHRDIKPSNLTIGVGAKRNIVYLLDFGISRKIRNEDGEIKLPRWKCTFKGTVKYASLACHTLREQSGKDDLECWVYLFAEFVHPGGLPWRNMDNTKEVYREKRKAHERPRDLFTGFSRPEYMVAVLEYIDELSYVQQIDYGQDRSSEEERHSSAVAVSAAGGVVATRTTTQGSSRVAGPPSSSGGSSGRQHQPGQQQPQRPPRRRSSSSRGMTRSSTLHAISRDRHRCTRKLVDSD